MSDEETAKMTEEPKPNEETKGPKKMTRNKSLKQRIEHYTSVEYADEDSKPNLCTKIVLGFVCSYLLIVFGLLGLVAVVLIALLFVIITPCTCCLKNNLTRVMEAFLKKRREEEEEEAAKEAAEEKKEAEEEKKEAAEEKKDDEKAEAEMKAVATELLTKVISDTDTPEVIVETK